MKRSKRSKKKEEERRKRSLSKKSEACVRPYDQRIEFRVSSYLQDSSSSNVSVSVSLIGGMYVSRFLPPLLQPSITTFTAGFSLCLIKCVCVFSYAFVLYLVCVCALQMEKREGVAGGSRDPVYTSVDYLPFHAYVFAC